MNKHICLLILLSLYTPLAKSNPLMMLSIPKSGTHLLLKYIEHLTGKKRCEYGYSLSNEINEYRMKRAFPTPEQLSSYVPVPHNSFHQAHLRHTQDYQLFLEQHNFKTILIIRDPRDLLVSRVHYLKDKQRQTFQFWQHSFDDLLLSLIGRKDDKYIGMKSWIPQLATNVKELCNINHMFQEFLPWSKTKDCYTVKFEDLVGSKGGGNDAKQLQEMINIAHHLDIKLTPKKAHAIAQKLFGNSGTFRSGQIGGWKKGFKPQHKKQFKKIAGQLLIDLGYEKDMNW